ncbi:MAG: hypothetical protein RJA36_796 [Pseudomonadota bacterium]|jgi:hypothetical protein
MEHAILFLSLLVAHAVCDYPLQGDFLAKAKNPAQPLPGVPWPWAMGAHAAIHAGAVAGAFAWRCGPAAGLLFGVVEFAMHFAIDYAKCRGAIGFSFDQVLHVWCKASYVLALWLVQ